VRKTKRQRIAAVLIVVAAGVAWWYAWTRLGAGSIKPEVRPSGAATENDRATAKSEDTDKPVERATGNSVAKPRAGGSTRGQAVDAFAAYSKGMKLMQEGKLVEARSQLATALNTGKLEEQQARAARRALTELAEKTIFSPVVYKNDPYTYTYRLKPGDTLQAIERREKLHVPYQLIMLVNKIPDATKIRAGQSIKLVRGPFHAVVRKSEFAMDVYLGETFVRRFRVCIGAPETPTPEGYFRVRLGGKLVGAAYTPPPSSGLPQKSILPGESGYPLDRRGLWISLTGIPEKGTYLTYRDGYGIHGTNDPASIGKAASHGCIRLADGDIDLLFAMLYEKWSTVTIVE